MKRGIFKIWALVFAYYLVLFLIWHLLKSDAILESLSHILEYKTIILLIFLGLALYKRLRHNLGFWLPALIILTFATNSYISARLLTTQIFQSGNDINISGYIKIGEIIGRNSGGFQYEVFIYGSKVKLFVGTDINLEFTELDIKDGTLKNPLNTGNYFYDENLWEDGIFGDLYVEKYTVLGCSKQGSIFSGIKNIFQNQTGSVKDSRANALLKGILLGDKSALSVDQKFTFKSAGISHIVVASGQNLAMLAQIIEVVLAPVGYLPRNLLILIISLGYAMMVGNEPSIWRAFIFISFIVGGRLVGRKSRPVYLLTITALALSVFKPFSIFFNLGFQLSFMAFLGVFTFGKLSSRFNTLIKIVLISLGAQIYTLPIILYNFEIYNVTSIISNIFVVFYLPVFLCVGVLKILTGFGGGLLNLVYNIFENILGFISRGTINIEMELSVYILIFLI